MADNKTPIRDINGHPVADQEARDQAAQNAERIGELSEEMAHKISGPVEILSFDGNPAGRDTFEMPFMEGVALTYVKISDSVFTADDLAPAIMAVAGADAIGLAPETTVYPDEVFEISGSYFVAVGGLPQIASTANKSVTLEGGVEVSIPSPGTYCMYVPEGGLDVMIGTEGSAPVYMTSYFKIDLIHESMLPNIPADKLPSIQSDMLPSIPSDKLPDGLVRYAELTVTVGSTTVKELMAAINPYSSDWKNGTLFRLVVKDGDTTYILQTTRMYVEQVYDSHSSYEFPAPILLTKSGYMAEQMLRKITLYFTDGIISSVGLVYPTSIRIGSYDITVNNGTLTATKAT